MSCLKVLIALVLYVNLCTFFVVFISVVIDSFFFLPLSLCAVNRSFTWYRSFIRKNLAVIQSLFFGAIAAAVFGISLVSGTFESFVMSLICQSFRPHRAL